MSGLTFSVPTLMVMMMIHPSRHYEISLSLSQLCAVRKKSPPQLLSSDQCAELIRRGESPCRGHSTEAWLHRAAMPSTASQRRPTVSRWLKLVTMWNSLRQPHAGDNHQRVVRHVPQVARGEPIHFVPCLHVRFNCSSVRHPGVPVGLRRSSARPPKLPPRPSLQQETLLAATVTTP